MNEISFFSIIIPTYNRASMLPIAIESVFAQTYPNWELIIVDDGSTDNTKEVVESYIEKDKRIKYLYQENAERSAARNNGITNAKGEYICFLDSDDEYLPNHLEEINNYINSVDNTDGIFIVNAIIQKNNSISNQQKEPLNCNVPTFFFKNSIIPNRVCIKKNILDEFQFDTDIRISEDTELFVRIAGKFNKIFQIDSHTVKYNIHDDNSINVWKNNVYQERMNTLIKLSQKNIPSLDKKITRQVINDCYFGIFKYYYFNNKIILATITMFKSILHYPNYRLKEKLFLLLNAFKTNIDFK